jgi:sodium-dependent dicarboxylate transporter 2/3/5
VALLPAIAFTATGVLDQTDVDSLEWDILILIGGGIALGVGMQKTGLDQIVVQAVPLSGPFVLIGLVVATVLTSTFMSNTAAANLLIPIGVSFAAPMAAAGSGPIQIGLSIALAASLSMALPVSTPPNAIAYASGELDTADFVRAGGLLGLLAVVLIVTFGGAVIAFWT